MKWFSLPAIVLVLATACTAQADLWSRLGVARTNVSTFGEPTLADGEYVESADTEAYSDKTIEYSDDVYQKGFYQKGYVGQKGGFGCCDPMPTCAMNLWSNYCAARHGCWQPHFQKSHGCDAPKDCATQKGFAPAPACGAPKTSCCKPHFNFNLKWLHAKSCCEPACDAPKSCGCDAKASCGHSVQKYSKHSVQKSCGPTVQKSVQKSRVHAVQKPCGHSVQKSCGCGEPKHVKYHAAKSCGCSTPCGHNGLFAWLHHGCAASKGDSGCGKSFPSYGKGEVILDSDEQIEPPMPGTSEDGVLEAEPNNAVRRGPFFPNFQARTTAWGF